MPTFARTIGIDYSGAETPTASLKGLRVYMADDDAAPIEVPPPPSPIDGQHLRRVSFCTCRASVDVDERLRTARRSGP